MLDLTQLHVGRSWVGTPLEDDCPCKKAPCGLVDFSGADPSCTEHPINRCKTLRQIHTKDNCPSLLNKDLGQ